MENVFSDANVSPEIGAELVDILGINALDLQTPEKAAKYKIVAEYFKRFSDAPGLARRVTRNVAPDERLDKMLQYTILRKNLDVLRSELNQLPSEDTISSEDPEAKQYRENLVAREQQMINEIELYE